MKCTVHSAKGTGVGLDDLVNKGKKLYEQNQDTIDDAIHSEQAEGISDDVLDRAAAGADKVSGGKHGEQVAGFRDKADGAVGNE